MFSKDKALRMFSCYRAAHPALRGAGFGMAAVLFGLIVWLVNWIYAHIMPSTIAIAAPVLCLILVVVFFLRSSAAPESKRFGLMLRIMLYAQGKFQYLAGFFLVLGLSSAIFQGGHGGLLFGALFFAILGVLPVFLTKFKEKTPGQSQP